MRPQSDVPGLAPLFLGLLAIATAMAFARWFL
jgi:hypothetical protein